MVHLSLRLAASAAAWFSKAPVHPGLFGSPLSAIGSQRTAAGIPAAAAFLLMSDGRKPRAAKGGLATWH